MVENTILIMGSWVIRKKAINYETPLVYRRNLSFISRSLKSRNKISVLSEHTINVHARNLTITDFIKLILLNCFFSDFVKILLGSLKQLRLIAETQI